MLQLSACKTTLMISLLEEHNKEEVIDVLLLSANSQIEFSFGHVLYEKIRSDISITNIKQFSLDQEKKLRKLNSPSHLKHHISLSNPL